VLAKVDDCGEISYRYFRAQPNASSANPCTSFYNPTTPTATSESRRRTILPFRHGWDERSSKSSPRRIWGDEGSPKTWSGRERVKAVSCVGLSPNGRFLAVGETGYNPRVNIFSSLPGGSTDIPLTILTEHSFGVRCVAFSLNSRWLATLGDINDGFLFIWSINPKTGSARLHFTNKCTASVLDMAWCGNSLITVGTRHVKVWRVGEPSAGFQTKQGRSLLDSDGSASPVPKTLSGRNSLLGSLADSTFTSVAPLSDCEAILCTKTGVVCMLDDRTGNQELKYIRQISSPTQSAAVDLQAQRIWFANRDGQLDSESFESLRSAGEGGLGIRSGVREETAIISCPSSPAASSPLGSFRSSQRAGSRKRKRHRFIVASMCLSNRLVSIDDERNIRVEVLGHGTGSTTSERASVVTLPAHNNAVQGVVSLPKHSEYGAYLTWSLGGTVHFWSSDGSLRRSEMVELEQLDQSSSDYDDYVNELKLIRVSDDGQWIISGDRLGVLQLIQCQQWTSLKARAHSAEMTDIASNASEQSLLVATSGRDRSVQLLQHRGDEIELLQTFDDHVGSVSAVSFVVDFLISASADRTVIVRQKVSKSSGDGTSVLAYLSMRVITLKASPMSMSFPEPDVLVVSTMDRQILTFSIARGVAVDGFKAFDAEGEDAVILSSLSITSVEDASGSRQILAGFSSTDKSIRLYDYDRGILLAREMGHTEGISDIALVEHADDLLRRDKKTLISTGLDGLIMIWDASTAQLQPPSTPLQELSQGQASTPHDFDVTPSKDSILRRPPLRKVLSKLDLADLTGLMPSTSSVHDQSPPRLKKKPSRHSVALCKLNALSAAQSRLEKVMTGDGPVLEFHGQSIQSPSPTSSTLHGQTPLRHASPPPIHMASQPDAAANDPQRVGRDLGQRSPSPPPASPSLPTTPNRVNRANKGRLRRAPSIPTNLHEKSHAQARRKSLGNANEFGSIGMASEQVCRTLRAYRKKIKAAPRTEQLQLDELEVELLATLRAVEERHERNGSRRIKAATENDLDNLASLIQTSGLGARPQSQRSHEGETHCNGHRSRERTEERNRSEA
jgi:WD40 repeat protein